MTHDSPSSPRLWTSNPLHGSRLPECEPINALILTTFRGLQETDFARRTHFFGGRFENLYLDRERLPAVAGVLAHAESCARAILGSGRQPLRMGFWFNAQGPGQDTSLHTHDEDDELLSGVYYVNVPEHSGRLVLLDGQLTVKLMPQPGQFLFFPPALPHRVEVNRSEEQRLSIAFNFGPAEPG